MPNFMPADYNQDIFIAFNFKHQLQPGTLEYIFYYLIENKLDLSAFYPRDKNDKNGRPGYDPSVLLKVILFAYSKGITSNHEHATP